MAEKLHMATNDIVEENIRFIAQRFPNVVVESTVDGKKTLRIDFDMLSQELSNSLIEGKKERFQFTWPDKKSAVLLANSKIAATLRPLPNKSVDFDNSGNVYIEGDNLDALKLLRETYLGKIQMIYIDPPYNTGGDFVYEDDFSKSTEEFQKQQGDYDDAGNRLVTNSDSNGRFHTDWLNMMYPRLKIARDLLSDDGVIFISIDRNEFSNLKAICDEIFGASNFVNCISWQKTYSPKNNSNGIPDEVEYIMVYSRFDSWTPKRLARTAEMDSRFSNPDNDVGPWTSSDAFAPGAVSHQGMVYAIQNPFSGELIYPYVGGCWRYEQNEVLRIMNGWANYHLEDIHDDERRAKICGITSDAVRKGVRAIMLSDSIDESRKIASAVLARGQWPKFYFTKNGKGGIRRKTYLENMDGRMPTNLWLHEEAGHNDEAKKALKKLFGGDSPFDTPKPVRLIKRMLDIATDKDAIILDFFSGSATTAEAVMQKNEEDGGSRRFILVQLPEASDSGEYQTLCDIGEERIRRAAHSLSSSKPLTSSSLDLGFRVFKVDSSNMREVFYNPQKAVQSLIAEDVSNIKPDRNSLDLLFQVMLELGVKLSAKIKKIDISGKEVFCVDGNFLVACFDTGVSDEVIKQIAELKPIYVVFRDASFEDDSANINCEQLIKAISPSTELKVL